MTPVVVVVVGSVSRVATNPKKRFNLETTRVYH